MAVMNTYRETAFHSPLHNVRTHLPSFPIPFLCLPLSALHISCHSQPSHVVDLFPLEAIKVTTSPVRTDY